VRFPRTSKSVNFPPGKYVCKIKKTKKSFFQWCWLLILHLYHDSRCSQIYFKTKWYWSFWDVEVFVILVLFFSWCYFAQSGLSLSLPWCSPSPLCSCMCHVSLLSCPIPHDWLMQVLSPFSKISDTLLALCKEESVKWTEWVREESTCSAIAWVENTVSVHPEPFESLTLSNFLEMFY